MYVYLMLNTPFFLKSRELLTLLQPNDMLLPPKQVSVDQAPSPKEALQPEESKGSTHSNDQKRSIQERQNGSQASLNKKLVGPPPLLPPPNIPLEDEKQAPSGSHKKNANVANNAPRNVDQRYPPNQNGALAENQNNIGPSRSATNGQLPARRSDSPVKPINLSLIHISEPTRPY